MNLKSITFLVIIILIVGVYLYFRNKPVRQTPDDFMKSLADFGVKTTAKRLNFNLCYDDAGVKVIEDVVMEELHKEYIEKTLLDEAVGSNSLMLAAVIGEALKRTVSATWVHEKAEDGSDLMKLSVADKEGTGSFMLNIPGWCAKRIYEGKTEDVYKKYQIVEKIRDAAETDKNGRFVDHDGNPAKID